LLNSLFAPKRGPLMRSQASLILSLSIGLLAACQARTVEPTPAPTSTAATVSEAEIVQEYFSGAQAAFDSQGRATHLTLAILEPDVELPPEIGQLRHLQSFELHAPMLTALPPEIGQLSSLESLELHAPNLTALPPEIGGLHRLKSLEIWDDHLTDLPPEIGGLSALESLWLRRTSLASLPAEIGQLSHLQSLVITDAPYLTTLPAEIGRLQQLQSLGVHGGSTTIPPAIGQLTQLTDLNLRGNRLTDLPPEIGRLDNLQGLDLGANQLTELPPEIGQLRRLTTLNLEENALPSVPTGAVQLAGLQVLNLGANHLTDLPAEIGQLSNLTVLNLGANDLTSLPPEIGQLHRLTLLNLGANHLAHLPPEIGGLASLEQLDLAGNPLGTLPPEIGGLTRLRHLNLWQTDLRGLPPEIGQLTHLTELDLGFNPMLTELPPQIGQLTNLTRLNLQHTGVATLPPGLDRLLVEVTPMPAPEATPAGYPLPDFPLRLGNTWVYSATHYDSYDTERITATYRMTETIVDIQAHSPYLAAQVIRNSVVLTGSNNLADKDWQEHYLAGPGGSISFWYVISGTHVYEQDELDWAKIDTSQATLGYVFPLSAGDRWYPDPAQRQAFLNFEVGPGIRTVVDGPVERQTPAGTFPGCFEIATFYNSGSPQSWFCPGVGVIESQYHHAGTPFGHTTVLIDDWLASPTVEAYHSPVGYITFPAGYGDAGSFALQAGATITLTWEEAPLDADRYDFILYSSGTASMVGSDEDSADGVGVKWRVPEALTARLRALAYLSDGRVIPSGWSGDIYTAQSGPPSARQLDLGGASIRAWAWSPDGQTIALAADKSVYLYPLAAPESPTRMEVSASELVTSLAYSPDSRTLAVGLTNGNLQLLDIERQGDLIFSRDDDPRVGDIRSLAFSPDGRWLALGGTNTRARSSADGIVRVLDLDTRAELASFEPYGWVGQVVFSPDTAMLGLLSSTTCGRGGSWVSLVDPLSGADRGMTIPGGGTGLAFSPDGTLLAVGVQEGGPCVPDGGFVWLWDMARAQPLGILPRHDDGPGGLTFSPDGTLLAASDGQAVHLWSLDPIQEVMHIPARFGQVGSAAFSPDARVMAYRDGETIQFKELLPDLATHPDPSVSPPLRVVEDFATYTQEQLQAAYTINDAGGLNQGTVRLAQRDGLPLMALEYTINQPAPNNYVLLEGCFRPEQDWRNARYLELWVENDEQPKTLVVQFGEGRRCAGEAFTGEVWRAFVPLLPGEKRPVDVRLVGIPPGRADWSPTQNQQLDLDRIGYFAVGLHVDKPGSGTIYLGPVQIWR
jgi:Leucine-rich repeat (LRR) protein/WD40 repeat protein